MRIPLHPPLHFMRNAQIASPCIVIYLYSSFYTLISVLCKVCVNKLIFTLLYFIVTDIFQEGRDSTLL